MPAELLKLHEQLANLQVLYDAALKSDTATDLEITKLREQIIETQDKILNRQELLSRQPEQGF